MYKKNKNIHPSQLETQSYGKLKIQVTCQQGSRPIDAATVQIYHKTDPTTVLEVLSTDVSGKTNEILLPAPPIEYSMSPSDVQPYSEYLLLFFASGLQTVLIDGTQILPDVTSIQKVSMPLHTVGRDDAKIIIIKPNRLFGVYPLKVYEDEIKSNAKTKEVRPIIIPEYLVVHDGVPSDETAPNYYVAYKDYVKNVVSSQIYATWNQETIYANILTTLSFSLNRFYTNWYKDLGYDFDITSTTAFDQLWVYGRNIYQNISLAVDYLFNYFLSRPDISQPILTQVCLGDLTDCPNMLSLWGSNTLGIAGYNALEILQYYYGKTLYINSTNEIAGITYAWQGTDLDLNSSGEEVKYLQGQLEIISRVYNIIPPTDGDGYFGPLTQTAVLTFQELFYYPVTGIVDAATWYGISKLYTRFMRGTDLCL